MDIIKIPDKITYSDNSSAYSYSKEKHLAVTVDKEVPRVTLFNYITKEIEMVCNFENTFDFGNLNEI